MPPKYLLLIDLNCTLTVVLRKFTWKDNCVMKEVFIIALCLGASTEKFAMSKTHQCTNAFTYTSSSEASIG